MFEQHAENRQRIAAGVSSALAEASIPAKQKNLIEKVTQGEYPSVTVGLDIVEILHTHKILASLVLTKGDYDAPGWKDIHEDAHGKWRVMEYYLREPNLNCSYDIGGRLTLEAARRGYATDYENWDLKWVSEHQRHVVNTAVTPSTHTLVERAPRPNKKSAEPRTRAKRTQTPKPSASLKPETLPQPIQEAARDKPTIVSKQFRTPLIEENNLTKPQAGEVLGARINSLGKVLLDSNRQPQKDEEGRLLAEFPGPPKYTARIPESLIGKAYRLG